MRRRHGRGKGHCALSQGAFRKTEIQFQSANGVSRLAQAAQMQAKRRAEIGTWASKVGEKTTPWHQHGPGAWPEALAVSMAQALAWPHKGQRVGSIKGTEFTGQSVVVTVAGGRLTAS